MKPIFRRLHIDQEHVPSQAALLARLGYVAILVIATLVPFGLHLEPGAVLERVLRALNPPLAPRDGVDAARNLVLFAGWGALWLVTAPPRQLRSAIVSATITGLTFGVAIEFLQLFSAERISSVLDVVTNTAGALGGALAIAVLTGTLSESLGRRSFVGLPGFIFAGAYLGATFLEAFFPSLRQAFVPDLHGGPLDRWLAAASHFDPGSVASLPLIDLILFVPLGALLVGALVERGRSYADAAWQTGTLGTGVLFFAEIGHGLVGQPIEVGPALVHASGLSLGAWAAARWIPATTRRLRGRVRPTALFVAYAILVLLWTWRPFTLAVDPDTIAAQLSLKRWIPLLAHHDRVDLFGVADVCKLFLLYLPLGSLLAVWPLRRRSPLAGVLPVAYLALLAELGQVLMADRYFDITDVLVATAAGFIGWVVTLRAGFRPYGDLLRATGAPKQTRQTAAQEPAL